MDEDFFSSDDDLDHLAVDDLRALEQDAYRSTQGVQPVAAAAALSRPLPAKQLPRRPQNASYLNRPSQSKPMPKWRPPQVQRAPSIQAPSAPPPSAPEAPSSDYGLDDEDVIDLDETSFATAFTSTQPLRPQTRVSTPAAQANHPRRGSRAPPSPGTIAAFAEADQELGAARQRVWNHAPHLQDNMEEEGDTAALRAKILELEADRQRLQRSVENAQSAVSAKQGEIKIVRSNQEKQNKDYERRIAVLNKLHADEVAKQKAEIETSKKEREKMQTDNQFLQHDLAQEADRAKRLNGPGRARSVVPNGNATPKRGKRKALGDGFADDEMMRPAPSPSRSKEKSRDATPKHGAKRKRSAQDSPVAALSFTQPPSQIRHDGNDTPPMACEVSHPPPVVEARDVRYEFVQTLLAHRTLGQEKRTVESCLSFAFPSQPETPLSSIILDALMAPELTADDENMAIHFTHDLLALWSRCLGEKYYAPVTRLLTLIRFVLDQELPSRRADILEHAIPVCCKTIDLVAVPTGRYAGNLSLMPKADLKLFEETAALIDVDETLAFLHHLAECATLVADRIDVFWRQIEFTFSLMIMHKAQPICQIITALHMLSTSVLSTSFGAVSHDPDKQVQQERDMIVRLTSLLSETPVVPKNEMAYTREEITELRLEVINLMRRMCQHDHGSLLLAQHRMAIGRLIRFLHEQLNLLYAAPPRLHPPIFIGPGDPLRTTESPPDLHTLLTSTIANTTRILYHLLTTHDSSIDFSTKLSAVRGGYHKFLVSFTRIAFREPLLFELGIEDDVVDAAHAILDMVLSPEEGEAVVKALETPRGSGGRHPKSETGPGPDGQNEDEDGDVDMEDASGGAG